MELSIFLLIKDFIFCFLAAGFFSLLISAPKKSIPISSAVASVGYVLYDIICIGFGHEVAAFFFGTLLISISSELLARVMRMPSTVFVVPAIVPLVPGVGIYMTMLHIVEDNLMLAAQRGTATLLNAAAMAVAIALGNVLAVNTSKASKTIKERRHS